MATKKPKDPIEKMREARELLVGGLNHYLAALEDALQQPRAPSLSGEGEETELSASRHGTVEFPPDDEEKEPKPKPKKKAPSAKASKKSSASKAKKPAPASEGEEEDDDGELKPPAPVPLKTVRSAFIRYRNLVGVNEAFSLLKSMGYTKMDAIPEEETGMVLQAVNEAIEKADDDNEGDD